jgi:predicted transcriptional regulator
MMAYNGDIMATAKEHIAEIIKRQPDDSSYDEIVRELAFDLMVQRGLKDSDEHQVIPNEEIKRRIRTWQK